MPAKCPNGEARGRRGPTTPPPQPPGLSSVLERNIQALGERRKREEAGATAQEKIAETITRFIDSFAHFFSMSKECQPPPAYPPPGGRGAHCAEPARRLAGVRLSGGGSVYDLRRGPRLAPDRHAGCGNPRRGAEGRTLPGDRPGTGPPGGPIPHLFGTLGGSAASP